MKISRLPAKTIFRGILISRFFELGRETAKFSCNKVTDTEINIRVEYFVKSTFQYFIYLKYLKGRIFPIN